MANTFYKLREGDKFYRIDYIYDDDEQLVDYVRHEYEMARDASIENYKVRFICYDRTFNKNTMFTYDLTYSDQTKIFYVDEDLKDQYKIFVTTSKRKCDIECKRLDDLLGKTVDNEEGQND